jgi:VWFA-related protein
MNLHHPQIRRGLRFPLCLAVLISANLSLGALKAQEPQPVDVIRVRTDLIAVPVIVTDARGHRISNLPATDFTIRDDRGAQKIEYFASGTERVALLFALDTSGSARDILAQQRQAALDLFAHFGKGSRVAVLHFSEVVRLTVPFTTNTEAAEQSLKTAMKTSGGTAIFDAAATAVRCFDGSGGFSTERRIVILVSDGLDTLSSTSYQTVIASARARGVSFYVIHFPLFTPQDGVLAPRRPSKGFVELAEETGGQYFRIGNAKAALDPRARPDLAPVFQAIERDLGGQYVLGFYPGEVARDGLPHRIDVGLSPGHAKLKIQQLKTSYTVEQEQ